MAISFPSSPTLNQTYSYGGKTWKWNNVSWNLTSPLSMVAVGYVTNPSQPNITSVGVLDSLIVSGNITGNVIGDLTGNATTVTNGVYITGNQSITGIKSFTDNIIASGGITGILLTSNQPNITVNSYTEIIVPFGIVSTTATLTAAYGTILTATLSASTLCTFTMPSTTEGKSFTLLLKQDLITGGGSATFTNVKWPTSIIPIITTTAGSLDILSFISDGTNWYGSISQRYTA